MVIVDMLWQTCNDCSSRKLFNIVYEEMVSACMQYREDGPAVEYPRGSIVSSHHAKVKTP